MSVFSLSVTWYNRDVADIWLVYVLLHLAGMLIFILHTVFSMMLIPFCKIQLHLFGKGDGSMNICLRVDMSELFTFDFSGRVW